MLSTKSFIDKRKFVYNKDAANRVVRFFETRLVHIRGDKAGEPFLLEDFQKEHIRNALGWYWKKDPTRRKHRFFYLEVPKGNGKSPLISGIILYLSCAEGDLNGENYCAAGDKDQARIVFQDCRSMVEQSPHLRDKFDCFRNSIIHKKTGSFIKVISADAVTKHGYRPKGIGFDEVHVQPNRELYDTLTKGLFKVPNSMCVMATTAGIKNTFAESIHDKAAKLCKGLIKDENWYCAIYAADEDDDPYSTETHKKANPGFGTIFKEHDFKIIVDDTKTQVTGLNSFKRLHLNLWTGSTHAWIPVSTWDKCNRADIKIEDFAGRDCYGGLDMASTEDLSSFALFFPKGENEEYHSLFCWHWCPEDTIIERERLENYAYRDWVKQGYVIPTPGNFTDQLFVEQFIAKISKNVNLKSCAFDPWKAKDLAAKMIEDYSIDMSPFTQNLPTYAEPTRQMEILVKSKGINHGGNPVLRYQIDNVEIYQDTNDNKRPHKGKSRGKIDGIMASIMSLGEWMDKGKDGKSIYDERGILYL